MDITTITMPAEEAQAKLEAYQRALRRRADQEYEAIAAGYEALAAGTPLINLTEAMRAGGFDEQARPRLAIARADRRQVEFSWRWNSSRGVFDTRRTNHFSPSLALEIDFPDRPERPRYPRGYALVPLVPADLGIPVLDMRRLFVLWEVEQWSDRSLLAVPDRDPYLLEHLGGDLYAVVAGWELTELERAVMAGRATA
ncbi:MAG: hypothetical protein JW820_18680 [Spirochaetales bacterium]|nr:hypothetical protein [Spirochaetales bacterium]